MKTENALVQKNYLLEKFPGKGGWTFAQIPEIPPDPHAHFGWVRVKGSIDGFPIQGCHLMPIGNGRLFLPVKAGIRKKIKKEAGDWVEVILYDDSVSQDISPDFLLCLQEQPELEKRFFHQLSEAERASAIQEINAAATEEKRITLMAQILNRLENISLP